ncbi:hypothetical protein D3C86_1926960 [compost metagenome]
MFLDLSARAPQVGEKAHVVGGAQDVRVHQSDNRQHQHDFQNGTHEVVAIIQQRRLMQVNLLAADELPEARCARQPARFPEAEQPVGNAVGGRQKQ